MGGITNPAEEYFKDGIWGWDGTVWRKLPLVWGYSDRYAETVEKAAVGAGNVTMETTTPPAGEVYVVQLIAALHDAVGAKHLLVRAQTPAVNVVFLQDTALASDTRLFWIGSLTLKAGDKIQAFLFAPGDGKKVYLEAWGYKMKVAE